MKFSTYVQEAIDKVEKEYEESGCLEIISHIQSIIDDLNWIGASGKLFWSYTMDELSRMAGTLASLAPSLIRFKYDMYLNMTKVKAKIQATKEAHRSKARDELIAEHTKKKIKAPNKDDISDRLEKKLVPLYFLEELHRANYEKLQGYRYGIPNICSRIDQRIRVLMWDLGTTKFMKDADDSPSIELTNPEENIDEITKDVDWSDAMN